MTPQNKKNQKNKINRIGVLTSGGDAPGMNVAIRAVVRSAIFEGIEVMGIQRGYTGLLEQQAHPMVASSVANILQRGGTILRTSRCDAFQSIAGRKIAIQSLKKFEIDGLVVIGGDGSFRGADLLHKESGIPVMGIPGTIDNDIFGTDDTVGFDTAVNTGIELIDKIRDTASSHDRLFLVEVMGRHSGKIALHTGIGGGAECIIIPEVKINFKAMCDVIDRGVRRGKTSSIIVVAEGCQFGGAAPLAKKLEAKGYHPRFVILGHTQRGGSPSAHDRMLASSLGDAAVQALLTGASSGMVGVQGGQLVHVPFAQIRGKKPELESSLLKVAERLAI